MNTPTMHTFNRAVENLDRRTLYQFDQASQWELLGATAQIFGASDPDVFALRDALRQQFDAMVKAAPRKQ